MVIKDTKYQVVINTVLIILSLMCVMPFILLLSSSITSETALVKTGYRFWPTEIDLSAYKYLLMDSTSIVRGYAISFFVTIVGTLTSLMLTTLYAYPLSRNFLFTRNLCKLRPPREHRCGTVFLSDGCVSRPRFGFSFF